jgi:hypothetical protein
MGQAVNSPEPGTEQAATSRLLDLVRSFVTARVSWLHGVLSESPAATSEDQIN